MGKSCFSCNRFEKCDLDIMKACRVWGGWYSSEVIDLRLWENKNGG